MQLPFPAWVLLATALLLPCPSAVGRVKEGPARDDCLAQIRPTKDPTAEEEPETEDETEDETETEDEPRKKSAFQWPDDLTKLVQGETKRFKWIALPGLGYDADDGLGFAAMGELFWRNPDFYPYRAKLRFIGYVSVRGHHNHRLMLDLPDMGLFHGLRFTGYLTFRRWANDGYWGMGNGAMRRRAYVGDFDSDDPRRKYYKYKLVQPMIQGVLRYDLGPVLGAYASLSLRWTGVTAYEGSLLQEHQPDGMDGGWAAQAGVGFVWDTRQPELNPVDGIFAEVSGRIVPNLSAATEVFGGPFASIRVFLPVSRPRVVMAWRIMLEWLFGDIPFYEMIHWGGSEPILGFGGIQTIRGVPFGRWRAPGKGVANLELRIDLFKHRALKSVMRWQAVVFGDVGGVWGAEHLWDDPAQPFPLHAGTGLGVRAVWAESFVARLDLGFAPDPILEEDGSISRPPNFGFYLTVDQMF